MDGRVKEDPTDFIEVSDKDNKLFKEAEIYIMKSSVVSNELADSEQHLIVFQIGQKIIFKLLAKK